MNTKMPVTIEFSVNGVWLNAKIENICIMKFITNSELKRCEGLALFVRKLKLAHSG